MKKTQIFLIALLIPLFVFANDELEPLELASLLVADGNIAKAERMLKKVDLSDEDLDKKKYHLILGLIQLKKSKYPLAYNSFKKAQANGDKRADIFIYLAKSAWGMKNYDLVVNNLKKSGNKLYLNSSNLLLMSASNWKLKNTGEAWEYLDKAGQLFPREEKILKQKTIFLVELGFFKTAIDVAKDYIKLPKVTLKETLEMAALFKNSKQYDEAILLTEITRLKNPEDKRVLVELGENYLKKKDILSSANLFEQASAFDSKYYMEASELYRMNKSFFKSLALNRYISNSKKKLRGLFTLFIENELYEQASLLSTGLSRVGLLQNDEISYGLAYSYFKTGDFLSANRYLKKIGSSDLFEKANVLRKTMANCEGRKWLCL
ncbi:MAG: tetratricopeptide repeat protein [Bacteriovoracaceae bacterium]